MNEHSQDPVLTKRFQDVMSRLIAIREALDLPAKGPGCTVVVDVAEVDMKARRYIEYVDQFLTLEPRPEIDDRLGKLLIDLQILADDIQFFCGTIKEPLDDLISKIHDRLPDDDDEAS